MLNRLHGRRPSPALVVSIVALIMSMAGTATAARVLLKSTSQVGTGVINSGDIRDNSVSSRDIRDNGVTLDDLAPSARATAGASAIEGFRKIGPQNQDSGKSARVATLSDIPSGTYAIFAKTILSPQEAKGGLFKQGKAIGGHCTLDADGDKDEARALLSTPGAFSPGMLNLQITRSFGGTGMVALDCDVTNSEWSASDTSIIAIRVGDAPRHALEG